MTDIYVVLPSLEFEGYVDPFGVFDNPIAAKNAADDFIRNPDNSSFDTCDVFKMELNKPHDENSFRVADYSASRR